MDKLNLKKLFQNYLMKKLILSFHLINNLQNIQILSHYYLLKYLTQSIKLELFDNIVYRFQGASKLFI